MSTSNDQAKKVNPMRERLSCPECGWLHPEGDEVVARNLVSEKGFDCGQCGTHFSAEDFDLEHEEKRAAQRLFLAKADLTGEQPDAPQEDEP